jgi:hypothetical protein
MTGLPINSASDLRAEMDRLRDLERQQKLALKARFQSPSAVFHTALSLFPKSPDGKGIAFFNQDIFGILSRVVLPVTLNRTLFKNSNFLVKTLVGFLSQKASHYISEGAVTGFWDKVKSVFERKQKEEVDYGIPPESEAS